jgi:signal transduction histidine kinase
MAVYISLRTRLALWVIFLMLAQVALVLFVIQRQEVVAIEQEQREKGLVLANSIIQENIPLLVRFDYDALKENLDARIDDMLVYIIFYNRFNIPAAGNDYIVGFDDIYLFTNLGAELTDREAVVRRHQLRDAEHNPLGDVLEIEVPIFLRDVSDRWGSVKLGLSLEEMHAEVRRTSMLLLGIGALGLLIGIIGATWLARRITTPLQKLVEGTKHISRGDFSLQIDIDSQDEVGNLARSFNEMSRQLQLLQKRMEEANKRLIQVEKLASIGHISAGIAHEIRNPLTAVKLNIQKISAKENLDEGDLVNLEISQEGIAQIEKFIKELLNYARVSELNLDWFAMDQIIDGSIKMIADSLELKNVTVEKHYAPDMPQVRVDADKVRQVILNMLRNSCEAVDVGGKIKVRIEKTDTPSGPRLRTEISDNGRGVPQKDWENVFEPFYTTKASGIGLGLAIARKILEQHDGTIRVRAQEGQGSCFEILLPCESET